MEEKALITEVEVLGKKQNQVIIQESKWQNVILISKRKGSEIREVMYAKEMKMKKDGHLRRWSYKMLKEVL